MNVQVLADQGSLEDKNLVAARAIFEVLERQTSDTGVAVGLCGGRSVVGLLRAILKIALGQPTPVLQRTHFFMIDERIVPLASPDSNFGGLKAQLFDELIREGAIRESQLHPFVASREGADVECSRYMKELSEYGGRFSVVVLGMGEDGHVAGLFPRHPVLDRQGKGFSCFFDSPKPPSERMTANRELITTADMAVLLALGEAKRDAWKNFLDQSISLEACPAKLVNSMARCVVVTDLPGTI